jgi:hypothetical protein
VGNLDPVIVSAFLWFDTEEIIALQASGKPRPYLAIEIPTA